MGYRLNRLDETIFMAVSKPMLTEFGIHYILESCEGSLVAVEIPECAHFAGKMLQISSKKSFLFHLI